MKNLLLPYSWKFAGLLLTITGIVFTLLYSLIEFRFTMPVFAVYSSFLETKMFVTFRTQFADELILLLLITGLALIVFSREKTETEELIKLRADALVKSILINTLLLILSIVFIYGSGFIYVLVFNLFSIFIIYLAFFYLLRRKYSS